MTRVGKGLPRKGDARWAQEIGCGNSASMCLVDEKSLKTILSDSMFTD